MRNPLTWTVWHEDAFTPDEWKHRSLTRLWLPLYDMFAILVGIWGAIFTPYDTVIQGLCIAFVFVAFFCFVSVIIPALHALEIATTLVLVGFLAASGASIIAFNLHGKISTWFIGFMILMLLPLPMYRLSLLGEEIKERRAEAASDEEG